MYQAQPAALGPTRKRTLKMPEESTTLPTRTCTPASAAGSKLPGIRLLGNTSVPVWKRLALWLYYHGSYPLRNAWRAEAVLNGRVPVVVLFYHRIADDGATPWTTSNRNFARQIEWLAEHFQMISLAEAQQRIARGENSQPAACITFDDGYAENCESAIPLLIERRIPCTYFVTLRNMLDDRPFDHDLARGYRFAPNSVEQVRAMNRSGIQIGAHTYTHLDLARVADPERLEYEIATAKTHLEDLLAAPVHYFAVPFGQPQQMTIAVQRVTSRAGYRGICSAYGGYNLPGQNAFHLRRIHGDDSLVAVKSRTFFDRRQLGHSRDFWEFALAETAPAPASKPPVLGPRRR